MSICEDEVNTCVNSAFSKLFHVWKCGLLHAKRYLRDQITISQCFFFQLEFVKIAQTPHPHPFAIFHTAYCTSRVLMGCTLIFAQVKVELNSNLSNGLDGFKAALIASTSHTNNGIHSDH